MLLFSAQRAITDVVGEESKSPLVFQACVSHAKSLITVFKTEERRKVKKTYYLLIVYFLCLAVSKTPI